MGFDKKIIQLPEMPLDFFVKYNTGSNSCQGKFLQKEKTVRLGLLKLPRNRK